jgi:hypothetical protein
VLARKKRKRRAAVPSECTGPGIAKIAPELRDEVLEDAKQTHLRSGISQARYTVPTAATIDKAAKRVLAAHTPIDQQRFVYLHTAVRNRWTGVEPSGESAMSCAPLWTTRIIKQSKGRLRVMLGNSLSAI